MQVSAAAVSASAFAAGGGRLELLVRCARILEGLAASKHAGGAPHDALALRLLTLQACLPAASWPVMSLSRTAILDPLKPWGCLSASCCLCLHFCRLLHVLATVSSQQVL